ncbi:MAG: hypothetical protein ACK5PS_11705 [Desulfopila sp.]
MATAEGHIGYAHTFIPDSNDGAEIEAALAGTVLRQSRREAKRVGLWLGYADGGSGCVAAVS